VRPRIRSAYTRFEGPINRLRLRPASSDLLEIDPFRRWETGDSVRAGRERGAFTGVILAEQVAKTGARQRSREASRPTARQPVAHEAKRQNFEGHAWRWHGWRLLSIWGFLLIAYSNSFQAGLVFDNSPVIGQDPRIRQATPQNIASILTGGYRDSTKDAGLYRPLTTVSYLLNYAVLGNGSRPPGYHWVNLAVHAVNVALVYALGIAVFGETAPAWAMAAIWALHPLLTESVTNIVGRADLLAAFGVLAGLLCYARTASAAGERKLMWLAGMTAAQAVGLFSKESAVVLPGLMLVYDLTWRERSTWRARSPAYAALALPFAAFFYLRSQAHLHMLVSFGDNPLVGAGFWTARLTAVKVIGKFLALFFWPARLSADYSYNAVPLFSWSANWEDAIAPIAMAVCLGAALLVSILAVRGRRAAKLVLFFLAFCLVAISPTSNLIVLTGSIMAERFFYLPSVGLAGCVVAAIYALGRRNPRWRQETARVAWAALAAVCLALAARTYARNLDWKDELSLWTSAVNVSPGSAKAHYNLGKALETLPGRLPEAMAEYQESLRIDPDHADAHDNLANALSAMPGRLPQAIAHYQAALRLQPDRPEVHNDLANALANTPGRLPEAIAEYRTALRIRPDSAELHYNLANALLRQPGGLTQAVDEYRAALRIDPAHVDAHINLGNALARLPGGLPAAIAEYRIALRIQPDSAGAHIALANSLSATPDGLPEAIAEYQRALQIRPDAEAHYDLGTALARVPSRLPEAIAEFESALRSEPNFPEALVNLGNALAQTPGRLTDAITEYEAALRIRPDPGVRQMVDRLRAERQAITVRKNP
jgi:tetratricopeptide (TPR) repeat protein